MPLVHETHGVFVYRVVHGRKVACRTVPHVGEEHAFGDGRWTLSGGDMVAVDCVQPSLVGSNNGARRAFPRRPRTHRAEPRFESIREGARESVNPDSDSDSRRSDTGSHTTPSPW